MRELQAFHEQGYQIRRRVGCGRNLMARRWNPSLEATRTTTKMRPGLGNEIA
jgi:hypothetical protein